MLSIRIVTSPLLRLTSIDAFRWTRYQISTDRQDSSLVECKTCDVCATGCIHRTSFLCWQITWYGPSNLGANFDGSPSYRRTWHKVSLCLSCTRLHSCYSRNYTLQAPLYFRVLSCSYLWLVQRRLVHDERLVHKWASDTVLPLINHAMATMPFKMLLHSIFLIMHYPGSFAQIPLIMLLVLSSSKNIHYPQAP